MVLTQPELSIFCPCIDPHRCVIGHQLAENRMHRNAFGELHEFFISLPHGACGDDQLLTTSIDLLKTDHIEPFVNTHTRTSSLVKPLMVFVNVTIRVWHSLAQASGAAGHGGPPGWCTRSDPCLSRWQNSRGNSQPFLATAVTSMRCDTDFHNMGAPWTTTMGPPTFSGPLKVSGSLLPICGAPGASCHNHSQKVNGGPESCLGT